MLEVLNKHLTEQPVLCVVAKWISGLAAEEQEAFAKITENSKRIHLATLFTDLSTQTDLPFKLTAFRSHIRGYCTCQK